MPVSWGGGDDYERLMGRWSRVLGPKFLDWAAVPLDSEILDVGCGTGALSEALLTRGVQAIVGVDPSSSYIEYASSRLGRKGNAMFQVGSATGLPFHDDRFGAAVSSLVLNFVPEPLRAVQEMRRVTRRNGLVAACVWDYAGRMEMLRNFWDAAVALNPAAKTLDEGIRFPMCNPGNLAKLFRAARLADVETCNTDIPMVFADFDDYWKPFLGGQGPSGGYATRLGEKERTDLREFLRSRFRPRGDGSISLVARSWGVRGIKV